MFTETHSSTTNGFGLINLKIGTINSGSFTNIDWGNGPYFIKVNVNGTELGGMQILSVPYAMYADKAGNIFSGDYYDLTSQPDLSGFISEETDPLFSLHTANSITSTNLTNWSTAFSWGDHSDENYIKVEIDGSVTNEIQDLADVLNQGTDASGKNITNLADPINDQDAATKKYIHNILVNLGLVPNNFEGIIVDFDGNSYKTIKIGTQIWMAENLKAKHFANGDEIPLVTDNNVWSSLSTGAQCIYTGPGWSDEAYGRLYNGYAVLDSRKLCPDGWHVPSDDEWKDLEMYLGMAQSEVDNTSWRGTNEGGKLKESGYFYWTTPNTDATNETGFTGRPGGRRLETGVSENIGIAGYWWSSSETGENSSMSRVLGYSVPSIGRESFFKKLGLSVRCIKD